MNLKPVVVALAGLGGLALTAGPALAMPNGLPQADQIANESAHVQQVRWICGPWGRCVWRPNWYGAYGYYYGPRPWYRWHRWHRWHHWY
jgi:hypothetical protein